MDNSSSNVVKFIATITVAALLLMAAHYYSQSRDVPPQPAIGEKAAPAKVEVVEAEAEPLSDETSPESDMESSDEEVIVEEIQPIDGRPSADIPDGGSADIQPPPTEG